MRHHVMVPFLFLFLFLVFSATPAYDGCYAERSFPVLNLCELLENWKNYHGKQIRVRAVYVVGAESALLHDPACRNGDGLTHVSFRDDTKGPLKKLDRIVLQDRRRRAQVVFEGVFFGPEPYGDVVDRKLPQSIRDRLEKAPRRYGHMGMFETEIRVTRVVEAAKVPTDVP